tara:strand:- start:8369 stop:10195 length:1827 start_codon:yes stop_codon:yes gene_type:complete
MTPTQTELRSCLGITDFAKRRAAIRKLFSQVARVTEMQELIDTVKDAPPSKVPKSVWEKRTASCIRDNMTVPTLCVLIEHELGEVWLNKTRLAITDPDTYAATGRRGLSFAEHHDIRREFDKIYARTSTATSEKPMSLTAAINAFDYARINGLADDMTIWSDLEAATDSDTVNGVKALVSVREDKDAPRTEADLKIEAMSKEDIDLYAKIISRMSEEADVEDTKPTARVLLNPPTDPALINLALAQSGLPPIGEIIDEMNSLSDELTKAESAPTMSVAPVAEEAKGDGTIPSGSLKTKEAHVAFNLSRGKKQFSFKVPCWEWDAPHPHVPEVDEDYVFRPFELLRVLYAIMTNQRCYLHGHTGSGKTTLVEQVAARLNWPFMRINFDSEITRMDLIGRDVLTNDGGVTSSKFVDGILPQMMSGPYIGCLDEIDFVRPDIAYVLQRALEGNGLMLTEDGGRMVMPHKLFRMFGTGNTVGQGDEFGLYQGARPQSMAFLDRFTVWIKVDYLKPSDRLKLIKARLPKLSVDHVNKLNSYITEHLEAFTTSKVMQPISPRGYLALGQAMTAYMSFIDDESRAVEEAISTTILDRASVNDRAVLKAIYQRVWG